MAQTAFRSGIPPTSKDWEDRRGLITRLYLEEDKTLKEVMVLVNVGGFKARLVAVIVHYSASLEQVLTGDRDSEKMYNTRIKQWGITKNEKEHEARAIVRLHHQRIGKPSTEMSLRRRPVNVRKSEMHLKRKGISIEDVLSSSSNCAPAEDLDLVCRTPPPVEPQAASRVGVFVEPSSHEVSLLGVVSSRSFIDAPGGIAKRVELPDGLKIVETMFADLREFMMSSIQDKDVHSELVGISIRSHLIPVARIHVILSSESTRLLNKSMESIDVSDQDDGVLALSLLIHIIMVCLWGMARTVGLTLMITHRPKTAPIAELGLSMMRCRLGRIFFWIARLLEMQEPFHLISQSLRRVILDIVESGTVAENMSK